MYVYLFFYNSVLKAAQYAADRGLDHQVCPGVCRGRRLVDDRQRGACKIAQQARRGVNVQRRTAYQQQVRTADGAHSRVERRFIQRFSVQHHVRLDDAAAAGAAQSRGGEVSNAAAAAGKRVRARKHSGASQNSWQSKLRPYLFIAPLVILSGVFIYYCIGFTVATSFTDWDGISSEMDFIGLKNYTKLLAPGSVFWTALMNNIIFMVVTVVIQAGLGLLLAVILKERLRGSSFFKAIFFMPIAMAPVIIAAIFRIIMDPNVGAINEALRFLHLDFLAQSWLGDPHIALYSICAINIFEWMGFSMIIYYAGLMSISDDIYEAAKIDGCGFWNTLFRITIPNLSGTTNTLILLGIVGSLKTFDIVIQTTGGGPGRSTEFLNTYLYKAGVQQFNGGLSAAIGVMVLIIAVMLSLIQLAFNKRANN